MRKLTSDEFKQYELGTLAKLDEICCENDIKYFVAYGTLIGAIRHKGFNPWDDDADVWMPRKDYDKFIEFCINNENLISPYKLAHYKNNSNYCMGIARLYDQRTRVYEEHVRDCGLGVFVDIYPLDGCGNAPKEALRIYGKNRKRRFLAGIGAPSEYEKSENGFVKNIIKWCCYKGANIIGIRNILVKMESESKKYGYEKSKFVASTVWTIYRKGKPKSSWIGDDDFVDILKREWFEDSLRVDFESIKVNIPLKYHEILSHRYGSYMECPPESERIGHHDFEAYDKE